MEPISKAELHEEQETHQEDLSIRALPRRGFLLSLGIIGKLAIGHSPVLSSVVEFIACDEKIIDKVSFNPENQLFTLLENITKPNQFFPLTQLRKLTENREATRDERLEESKETIDSLLRCLAKKIEFSGLLESNRVLGKKVEIIREALNWKVYEAFDGDVPEWVIREELTEKSRFECSLADCDVGEDGFVDQEYRDEVAQSLWDAMERRDVVGETGIELSFVRSYLKNARISLQTGASTVEFGAECKGEDVDIGKRICKDVEEIIKYFVTDAWRSSIDPKSDRTDIDSDIRILNQYAIDSFSEILPDFRYLLPEISNTLNRAFAEMQLSLHERVVQLERKASIDSQKSASKECTREEKEDKLDCEEQWQEMWHALNFVISRTGDDSKVTSERSSQPNLNK